MPTSPGGEPAGQAASWAWRRWDLSLDDPLRDKSLRSVSRVLRWAVQLVWQAGRREMVLSLSIGALTGVALGAVLVAGQQGLEAALPGPGESMEFSQTAVIWSVAGLAAASLVFLCMQAYGRELTEVLTELAVRRAQARMMSVAARVDLEAFEVPRFHDLLSRASTQGAQQPMHVVQSLALLVSSVTGLVAVGWVLVTIHVGLILLMLGAALPLYLVARLTADMSFRLLWQTTPLDRRRGDIYWLMTNKDPAAEIRMFRLRHFLTRRYFQLSDAYLQRVRRTARQRFRASAYGAVATTLILTGTLGFLVWLLTSGRTSPAETIVALGATFLLSERMTSTATSLGTLLEASRFLGDYRAFVELEAVVDEQQSHSVAPTSFERVSIEHVTFVYPSGQRPAVDDVSLELRKGRVTALVGENGSGKTTLAKLLSGLYRPQRGRVAWDGTDIGDLDTEALRKAMAVVFQDFVQYPLTARENIGVGAHERVDDLAAAVSAGKAAGADEFIRMLRDGYETVLTPEYEGGSQVSRGQWQRIALARAFFADAGLIVLDEPSSALDPAAEYELLDTIKHLSHGRTVLIVSHRLSTVRWSDQICVLHEGRLVEQGTHDELVERGGRYARMFALQASAYVSAEPVGTALGEPWRQR